MVKLFKLAGGVYISPLLLQLQLKRYHLFPKISHVSLQDFMTEIVLFH